MSDEVLLAYQIGRLEGMLEAVRRGSPTEGSFIEEARRIVDLWHFHHPEMPGAFPEGGGQ